MNVEISKDIEFDCGYTSQICDIPFEYISRIHARLSHALEEHHLEWKDVDRIRLYNVEYKDGQNDIRVRINIKDYEFGAGITLPMRLTDEEK